jgi:hypothetical protein
MLLAWENLNERDSLDQNIDKGLIMKEVLNMQYESVWTEFNWPRMGSSGRLW